MAQPVSTLIPNLVQNMTPQLAVLVLWSVDRYFTGDVAQYSTTGKCVNVFWGHVCTGEGGAAKWERPDAISWVPGVNKVWATETADLLELLDDFNKEGTRLGPYVRRSLDLVHEARPTWSTRLGAVLRPLGILLVSEALNTLWHLPWLHEQVLLLPGTEQKGAAPGIFYKTFSPSHVLE